MYRNNKNPFGPLSSSLLAQEHKQDEEAKKRAVKKAAQRRSARRVRNRDFVSKEKQAAQRKTKRVAERQARKAHKAHEAERQAAVDSYSGSRECYCWECRYNWCDESHQQKLCPHGSDCELYNSETWSGHPINECPMYHPAKDARTYRAPSRCPCMANDGTPCLPDEEMYDGLSSNDGYW